MVPRGDLRVTGWAIGPDGPLERALVLIDGSWAQGARTGMHRPDVAAAHPHARRSEWSGWEATLDLRRAVGPVVEISLLAPAPDGSWSTITRCEVRIDQSRSLGGRRPRAAFTIVQNEATFLPVWLDYYGRHFDPADIYVLDHDSTDGSTEGLADRCNVLAIHRDHSFDHVWMKSAVEAFQAFLLRSYDTVLFAEADEFVVPDPVRHEGLGSYVDALEGPAACCTGFNVIHYPADGEPPVRFDRPLLGQRGFWHRSPKYSKRVLSRVPLAWTIGFHQEANLPEVLPDPSLYLIHLHRVDYDLLPGPAPRGHRAQLERIRHPRGLRRARAGWSTRMEFAHWFHAGADLEGSEREPIPRSCAQVL